MVFLYVFKRSCKVSENLLVEAWINEKQNLLSLMRFLLENFTLLRLWQLLQILEKLMESLVLVDEPDLPLDPQLNYLWQCRHDTWLFTPPSVSRILNHKQAERKPTDICK